MRLNVWDAYRVGMRTKTGGDGSFFDVLRALGRNIFRPKRISWHLSPMDFLRYREFDFALREFSKVAVPRNVLDLSSPKLLPLTIASHLPDAKVISTDILDREVQWIAGKRNQLRLHNLRTEQQDARRLTYPSESFDLITSISVFEHIAPEIGGDLPAIGELARVLAPGGTAIVTIPFARKYFADFNTADVYERQSRGERIFFQRFYTPQMLHTNFIEHSGLTLVSVKFVEEQYYLEDPRQRIARWINCSPTQNLIFGPLFPLLSHIFLSPPRPLEKCRKPYIACLVLRKPLATTSRFLQAA